MIQRIAQPTTDRIGNSLIRDLPSRRCTDSFIEPAWPTTSKKKLINKAVLHWKAREISQHSTVGR
jgi:hypothetical protein